MSTGAPVFDAGDSALLQVTLPDREAIPPASPARAAGIVPVPAPASGDAADALEAFRLREAVAAIEKLSSAERERLEKLQDLLRARNPYRIDAQGRLSLPGFPPIALGGLTEEQATRRVQAEPALRLLWVKVERLPVAPAGVEALRPFGYDLFDDVPSTFAPVTEVPVPADYVVGPGDELRVQLFGTENRNLRLVVSREGTVSFPELGPIRVAGLRFSAAKAALEDSVSQQMIGVRADVTMGDTRSVRVFVLGEARRPGSYTVSGLATMTAALFASGGVKTIGSLRDIQLKRQGQTVARLDLYDLLLGGDTSGDARLLPGDVIFIPPVGPTVSVDGEVKRPAIYEMRGDVSVTELLRIAGGFTPEADPVRASVTRIDAAGRRVVLDLNLVGSEGRSSNLRNGDVLQVRKLRPQIDSGVLISGFVHRPGPMAWRDGLRLSDVLPSLDELRPNADPNYVLVRRETSPERRVEVLSADLEAALAATGSARDILLKPRDQVTVFERAPGRERIIGPLLEELRQQSQLARPTAVVRVEGEVKAPGEYPLEPDMRVSDLLRAGGNLTSAAFGIHAELARYVVEDGGARRLRIVNVDLAAIRRGDREADLQLTSFDHLLVKETPEWAGQGAIFLRGEVRFPGRYPIRRGETLRQVIERAGGLTELAYPRASVFTRQELKVREQLQLEVLSRRLRADVATITLQAAVVNQGGSAQALAGSQQVLQQLEQAEAVGRLVIDLEGMLAQAAGSDKDIELRDGDQLVVPKLREEVTILGEVQSATSHRFERALTRDDYIALSGGLTRRADAGRIYIVRADGRVVGSGRSALLRRYDVAIQPGDTIVVPLDAERLPRLPLWQAVTQIIFNLAIAVSAINSF